MYFSTGKQLDDGLYAAIYVSSNGTDSQSCLTYSSINHCKTLKYAVENSRGSNVNIYLHQSTMACDDEVIQIKIYEKEYGKTLHITGNGAVPLQLNCSLEISGDEYSRHNFVKLYKLIFYYVTITLCNSQVIFENCTFVNSFITDCLNEKRNKLLVQGLILRNVTATNYSGTFIELIYSNYVELEILASDLYTCLVKISSNVLLVTVNDTIFTHSGAALELNTLIFSPMLTRIKLTNIVLNYIETNKGPFSKGAVAVEASLLNIWLDNVISGKSAIRTLYAKNLDVGNFRSKFYISFENCSFDRNHHVGSGGAIFVDFQFSPGLSMAVIDIKGSKFLDNKAGGALHASAEGGAIYVSASLTSSEVSNFHSFQYLMVNIFDCYFENNMASDNGGNIFLTENTYSRIINSNFLMHNVSDIAFKGAFVLSKGKIKMSSVDMYVDKGNGVFESQSSLVHLQMNLLPSEVEDLSIILQCPLWHYLDIRDDFQLSNEGNHTALQTFLIFCSKCPDTMYMPFTGQYNITQSKMDISVVAHSESGYTKAPSCQSCPYGGLCSAGNVQARPNYWGYSHEGTLHFAQCPAGYCCSGRDTDPCDSYASCYGHRSGQLCGACREGYTVSILSGDCVIDTECTATWFWALAILGTFSYML